MNFTAVLNVLGVIGGLAAAVAVIYIALNRGLIENYKATVESQEKRIADQDRTISELQTRVAKLEGERDGYALAAELWVKAISTAGVCDKAWDCEDRVLPRPDAVGS